MMTGPQYAHGMSANSMEFRTRLQLGLILFLATTALCCADEPLAGRWSGEIPIPGHELMLIVDLVHNQNWSGSATLPGINVQGAPLTDIKVDRADLSFGIQAMSGPAVEPPKIKAHLTDNKLVGDFVQAGNTAAFNLKKIGPPQVEEPPRSTPVGKEFEGEWNGSYEMFGYSRTVTLKLQNHNSQPASAEFVIVGRKVNKLPVDRISQSGNFLTIESNAFGITYEGRLQNGDIHGTVLQGPIEIALVLHRPK